MMSFVTDAPQMPVQKVNNPPLEAVAFNYCT